MPPDPGDLYGFNPLIAHHTLRGSTISFARVHPLFTEVVVLGGLARESVPPSVTTDSPGKHLLAWVSSYSASISIKVLPVIRRRLAWSLLLPLARTIITFRLVKSGDVWGIVHLLTEFPSDLPLCFPNSLVVMSECSFVYFHFLLECGSM